MTQQIPSLEAAAPQPLASDDTGVKSPWLQQARFDHDRYKTAIGAHVADHFVKYGMVIYIGPGTTNNCVAEHIFQKQKDREDPLDLVMLTNNLTIFAHTSRLVMQKPEIFGTTQLMLTGGTYHASINSVVGRFAANAIESAILSPHVVFVVASGVSFEGEAGTLTYHFQEELDVQRALATVKTEHRILLCDHSKLGSSARWRGASVADLLHDTPRCTIITTHPDPDSLEELARFQAALGGFVRLLDQLEGAAGSPFPNGVMMLRVIGGTGVVGDISSADSREQRETARAKILEMVSKTTVVAQHVNSGRWRAAQ